MSLIQTIKQSAGIVETARRYVSDIKRGGPGRWVCRCLCGQNTDRHPSFMLYERDGHFHCFACQRHGDVIDLVALCERCDTREAVRRLRDSFNAAPVTATRQCTVPSGEPKATGAEARRALNAAVAHYASALAGNAEMMDYLTHERGLTEATIQRLRIGYASGQGLARAVHRAGIDLSLAARAGLLNEHGEHLRERIVLPVLDGDDAVFLIGRATRRNQQPKYLGLPDGLAHKQPMVIGKPALGSVVVEGAFDFAALVQWGFDRHFQCVGLLGTAHSRVMSSLVSPVWIWLDQDRAGKESALKLALTLTESGLRVLVPIDFDRHEQLRSRASACSDERERAALGAEADIGDALRAMGVTARVRWGGAVKDPADLLTLPNGQQLAEAMLA